LELFYEFKFFLKKNNFKFKFHKKNNIVVSANIVVNVVRHKNLPLKMIQSHAHGRTRQKRIINITAFGVKAFTFKLFLHCRRKFG